MRSLPSLVAAAVTVAVVGVALATANDEEGGPASTGGSADHAAIVGVAPDLPQLVAAFRRPQQQDDEIPGGDPTEGLEQIGAAPGENPRLARRLEPLGGRVAYAWPKSDGVCFSWGGSGGCGSTSRLEQEGAVVGYTYSTLSSAKFGVFVLVRDGVTEVQVHLEGGRTITQPVRDNAVWLATEAGPLEVEWRRPDGTVGIQKLIAPPG